ncbi:cell wall anchor protein, partial [Pseudarthrobacter sp. NPDC057230]
MNCTLRRGLLSTLFAGGLLAFGCAAANAADTTSGTDLSASALISAAAPADSTSLGLLGDPTPAGSTGVAAAVDVNLGLGSTGTTTT